MGLLFQFPNQHNPEDDRIQVDQENTLTLKTYGLPWVFWGYLVGIMAVLFVMAMAIRSPLESIFKGGDQINTFIGYLVIITMVSIPLTVLCILFYEKMLIKKGERLTVIHRLFWIPLKKTVYQLSHKEAIELRHFMEAPNVARIKHEKGLEAFENRGHYEVIVTLIDKRQIVIDRHSQKHDIKKFIELLKQY